MRRRLTYVALAALVLLAAGASSTFAARGSGNVTFVFNGRLLSDAGNSSSLRRRQRREQARAQEAGRPERYPALRGRRRHAVPALVARCSDGRLGVQSRRRRCRQRPRARGAQRIARRDRRDRGGASRRPGTDARFRPQAAVVVRRDAQCPSGERQGLDPRPERQLARPPQDAGSAARRVLQLRASDDLRPLAQRCADADLACSAARRRPDLDQDPRSSRRHAPAGGAGSRQPHRRPRATHAFVGRT